MDVRQWRWEIDNKKSLAVKTARLSYSILKPYSLIIEIVSEVPATLISTI